MKGALVFGALFVLLIVLLMGSTAQAQGIGTGKPVYYAEFNGATSVMDAGTDSSLADLHGGSFTVDGWVRSHDEDNAGAIVYKSDCMPCRGWFMHYDYAGALTAWGFFDGGRVAATSHVDAMMPANTWNHIAMVYDAGTGLFSFAVNGDWNLRYGWQTAGTGAPSSDAGVPFLVGVQADSGYWFDGDVSWLRVSRGARYEVGIPFAPPDVRIAPDVDVQTVEQWNMDDGHGERVRAEVNRANNGVLTDGAWVRWPR